jgi:hypothetical protein
MLPLGPRLPAVLLAALAGCASGQGPSLDRRAHDASASVSDPLGGDDAGIEGDDTDASFEDAGTDGGTDAGTDARTCVAESCNGGDDDCDGRIDEGAGCPCETLAWEGRSYLFCDSPRNWAGARIHCESNGYSLAVIDDASEDAFVFTAILARGWGDTWLGHNDLFEEGVWVWLDDSAMTYVNWDEGEPNDTSERGGEDCGVVMTQEGRESYWDDRPCTDERAYVCETR